MLQVLVISPLRELQNSLNQASSLWDFDHYLDRRSGMEALQTKKYEAVLCDVDFFLVAEWPSVKTPEDGLNEFKKRYPHVPFIVLCNQQRAHKALDLMRHGADSYVMVPTSATTIDLTLTKVLNLRRKEAELEYLRKEILEDNNEYFLLSQNEKMQSLVQSLRDVSPTKSTVLLSGDTGVGKGVLAQFVHQHSSRKDRQFIRVHCGAIPENLIESELFGHEKGAFTGAIKKKLGKFELAHLGTIFLDEISTLTPSAQIKLLHVLQDGVFQRVGGETDIKVDIRVIAATNEDLKALCEKGRFRKDLYYRLNVFPIIVPPLRERREDIPELVQHFTERLNQSSIKTIHGIQPEALSALIQYSWPGNIRELENLIERAHIIEKNSLFSLASFPAELQNTTYQDSAIPVQHELPLAEARHRTIEIFERQYITSLLKATHGRVTEASDKAGIGVRQMNKLMLKYNIHRTDYLSNKEQKHQTLDAVNFALEKINL